MLAPCSCNATPFHKPHALSARHTPGLFPASADGFVARRYGQSTSFGAVLDVLVDNASRGVLWVEAIGTAGAFVIVLEMVSTVCNLYLSHCYVDAG